MIQNNQYNQLTVNDVICDVVFVNNKGRVPMLSAFGCKRLGLHVKRTTGNTFTCKALEALTESA